MSGIEQQEGKPGDIEKQKKIHVLAAQDKSPAADPDAGLDADLNEALRDFKSSMHAWSDAAYHRPRALAHEVKRRSWRLATGWALGCLLLAGGASGLVYERRHGQEISRIAAAQRTAEQQKQLREQQARATVSDEVLLADVESDVSRQVPSAMEPLAQMMEDTK
jgi:hypothetical protein